MDDVTLETYNQSAQEFREYFKGIGARTKDIELALRFADKDDGTADVLEIGCGDGRDASEIVKHTRSYEGIDYSESFIELAKDLVPNAEFATQDMLTFDYPNESYDVVFAFASLLHVSKDQFAGLLPKIAGSLRAGGIFYLSLKHSDEYKGEWKEDQFGKRLFYYYNPEIISELTKNYFAVEHTSQGVIGHTLWFEMALRKK